MEKDKREIEIGDNLTFVLVIGLLVICGIFNGC